MNYAFCRPAILFQLLYTLPLNPTPLFHPYRLVPWINHKPSSQLVDWTRVAHATPLPVRTGRCSCMVAPRRASCPAPAPKHNTHLPFAAPFIVHSPSMPVFHRRNSRPENCESIRTAILFACRPFLFLFCSSVRIR